MHIDHLHCRKFFQCGSRCQSRCQGTQPLFQCDLQTVGHEGDKDMRFDALILLVIDRPDRQIAFQFLEGLLDFGELDVVLP